MTNMQAALGLAQLEKIQSHILRKREIGSAYKAKLKNLSNFQLPLDKTEYAENIYWIFGLVATTPGLCEKTISKLKDAGIATRPFFWCMHEQPVFNYLGLFVDETYPIAEKLARNGFYLPSGVGLNNEELEKVISEMLTCEN